MILFIMIIRRLNQSRNIEYEYYRINTSLTSNVI